MLTSISPLGERARGNRYGITAAAHVTGSVLGGGITGAVSGALGWLLLAPLEGSSARAVSLAAVAACVGLAVLVDRRGVPTVRRQVDERWVGAYRGWVYGAGFGVQLGMGVVTIVPSALVYATFGAAAATGSVPGGVIVGAVFGAGRGLGLLLGAGVDSPAALAALNRKVVTAGPSAAHAVSVAAVVLGIGTVVALGAGAG
jgi:hypothetical protein